MKRGINMNNQVPYIFPFHQIPQNNFNNNEYERLEEKIERLEKNVRILENRINKLEKNTNSYNYSNDEKNDMYML